MEEKLYFAHVVDEMVVSIKETTQEWVYQQEDSRNWFQTFRYLMNGSLYKPGDPGAQEKIDDEDVDPAILATKNFAVLTGYYHPELKFFYSPKVYPSWILNEEKGSWEPPIKKPADEEYFTYIWNEKKQKWTRVNKEDYQGSFRYGWK